MHNKEYVILTICFTSSSILVYLFLLQRGERCAKEHKAGRLVFYWPARQSCANYLHKIGLIYLGPIQLCWGWFNNTLQIKGIIASMTFYLGIFNKLKITKICFHFNSLLHVSLNSCAITTKKTTTTIKTNKNVEFK